MVTLLNPPFKGMKLVLFPPLKGDKGGWSKKVVTNQNWSLSWSPLTESENQQSHQTLEVRNGHPPQSSLLPLSADKWGRKLDLFPPLKGDKGGWSKKSCCKPKQVTPLNLLLRSQKLDRVVRPSWGETIPPCLSAGRWKEGLREVIIYWNLQME